MIVGVMVLVVVLVLVAAWAGLTYNRLVGLRNRVEGAWAQVDVQLQRRHDLVPTLLETVKGSAAHERETLDAVVAARNAGVQATGPAEQAEAEEVLTSALRTLFAVVEAYPDLKANENFLQLQEELTGTEGRIAYARQYFNDSVQVHNTKIETFPSVLIARTAAFGPRAYFTPTGGSHEPAPVKF